MDSIAYVVAQSYINLQDLTKLLLLENDNPVLLNETLNLLKLDSFDPVKLPEYITTLSNLKLQYSFELILVSPGGFVKTPYPVLVWVDYVYQTIEGKVTEQTRLYDVSEKLYLPNNTLMRITLENGFGDTIDQRMLFLTHDERYQIQLNITTTLTIFKK